jgi:Zn-dependent protease with chaperone function
MEDSPKKEAREDKEKIGAEKHSLSYILYQKYFKSRFVSFLFVLAVLHVAILMSELVHGFYIRRALQSGQLPPKGSATYGITKDLDAFRRIQTRGVSSDAKRVVMDMLDKTIHTSLIVTFFSHSLRKRTMRLTRRYHSFVRVHCSHIKETDVNFMTLVLFTTGLKSILMELFFNGRSIVETLIPIVILLFRCVFVIPLVIWLFSSVYHKTRWFLILSGYAAVMALMFLVNCTSVLGDVPPDAVNIPYDTFPRNVQSEIKRLGLGDRIYWQKDTKAGTPNAALVKAGSRRFILVIGDLAKYGRSEFNSFVTHEIGHADDLSTEKKMVATALYMGVSCFVILALSHCLIPKYHTMGVSRFTTLFFIFMAYQYVINNALKMFLNNLGILSEVNADLYARGLGYGSPLAKGLFKLSMSTKSYIFPLKIYTHYAQDHPSIYTRVEYLMRDQSG